jgi:hypothetical protein
MSCKKYMGYARIVVLDDDHAKKELVQVPPGVKVVKTPWPKCGEINAYKWACDNKHQFDIFIYLHDSTRLLQPLPLECNYHFIPLWYSHRSINRDMTGPVVKSFIQEFKVKNSSCESIYASMLQNEGSIAFGCMAIFDKVFLEFLSTETNFLDLGYKLTTRSLRSFFERVLYMIYVKFGDPSVFNSSAICGNIFLHKKAFTNTDIFDFSLANNPYVLKCWQGR